jgi:hypothetical protein
MRLLFTFGTTALIAGVYLLAQEQTAPPAKPDQDQSGQDQQASATRGMPARATPGDYQTHADAGKVTIAAEFFQHTVPSPQGILGTEEYVVVEAGVFGPP